MEHSKFSLDGPAFEHSTPQVIRPDHIMPLQGEAGVDIQIVLETPAPPEEQDEESSLLKCILEDAHDRLHAFQEYEHYCFGFESGPDCDVPEDEFDTDEMEDLCSDEDDQLVPVNLQEERKVLATEEDHGQQLNTSS